MVGTASSSVIVLGEKEGLGTGANPETTDAIKRKRKECNLAIILFFVIFERFLSDAVIHWR
jgi:hypothetical protein